MGAMFVSLVDRFALAVLLEPVRKGLMLTDAQLGLLGGISFGLFYAVASIPLGYLADRWSRTGTITLGMAIWCLATAACGFATSFWLLLIARIFVGAGEAALAPAGYSLIRDIFPASQLSRAMSVFQLGAVLGSGIGFLTVGFVYAPLLAGAAAHIPVVRTMQPWQQTFLTVGLAGIVFVLLVANIREPPGKVHDVPRAGLKAAFARDSKFYFLLFAAMSGIITLNYSFLSWMPAIMNREYGRSISAVGKIYGTLVLISSTIGVLSGAWFADRLQKYTAEAAHSWIILISVSIVLPVSVALPLANSWFVLLSFLFVFHVGAMLPIAVVPALIQLRAAPGSRSQVSAAYVMTVNLCGLGLGPAAIGFLSQALSGRANSLRLAVADLALFVAPIAAAAAAALLRSERARCIGR
jgi:MFS family permease